MINKTNNPQTRRRAHTRIQAMMLAALMLLSACQTKQPDPIPTPAPGPITSNPAPVNTAKDTIPISAVPIYANGLSAGWTVENGWGITTGDQSETVHASRKALSVTGRSANAALFFSVAKEAATPHPRRDYIGLRFWIYPSNWDVASTDLSIAVVGSDKIPYWSREDQSVPQQDVAYSGETQLLDLGIAHGLPANTWTQVVVYFNHLQFVPPTRYLTGFYLRGANLAKRAFIIDEVELLALRDTTPPAVILAEAIDTSLVNLVFNKDLDRSSAEDSTHYTLTSPDDPDYSKPLQVASASYDAASLSVNLTLAKPLKLNTTYALSITNLADTAPAPANVLTTEKAIPITAQLFNIDVDASSEVHPISPFIYGVSGAPPEYLAALHTHLNSWGGNASSTYNWTLGNAWNAARDWEYRNGNYGYNGKNAADDFISQTVGTGTDVLMTLPTIGWVAKNSDNNTCSFPGADGKCSNQQGASCRQPGTVADPNKAYVPSDVKSIVAWVKHMVAIPKANVQFLALDNEPDVWGETHYDIHPNCTTYDEILNKYIEYADAIHDIAPNAKLFGPVSCCWYYYWNSMAGATDKLAHANKDFLPWYLEQMRLHDEQTGKRTLDVLDIHYYPAGFYNDQVDAKSAEGRLRSTRSLWDKTYPDESWIKDPVYLIPRMKEMIAANYPGTLFGISEWNWGADKTMNGALALADVLGIYGREDVFFATYWRYPEINLPGFFGFSMYTNYDGKGSDFGDTSVHASSFNQDKVSVYASIDSKTGKLMVMMINKDTDNNAQIKLNIKGFKPSGKGDVYRYTADQPKSIAHEALTYGDGNYRLPTYSINLFILDPQK